MNIYLKVFLLLIINNKNILYKLLHDATVLLLKALIYQCYFS